MTMNKFYVRGHRVRISPNIKNDEFDYELDIATDSDSVGLEDRIINYLLIEGFLTL
mgnify:FL=1